jgi:hypothetical protein
MTDPNAPLVSTQLAIQASLLEVLTPLRSVESDYPLGGVFDTEPAFSEIEGNVCLWVDPASLPDSERPVNFPEGARSWVTLDRVWNVFLATWSNVDTQGQRSLIARIRHEWTDTVTPRLLYHVKGGVNNPVRGTQIRYADLRRVDFVRARIPGIVLYHETVWEVVYHDKISIAQVVS